MTNFMKTFDHSDHGLVIFWGSILERLYFSLADILKKCTLWLVLSHFDIFKAIAHHFGILLTSESWKTLLLRQLKNCIKHVEMNYGKMLDLKHLMD